MYNIHTIYYVYINKNFNIGKSVKNSRYIVRKEQGDYERTEEKKKDRFKI